MSESATSGGGCTSLKQDAIGWFGIFLMVITTNGPLTSMGGGVPVSITLGNGIGFARMAARQIRETRRPARGAQS